MKKLELKNLTIKKVSEVEQETVTGGFLSIGHACSHRTQCDRLYTKCWGGSDCIDAGTPSEHF